MLHLVSQWVLPLAVAVAIYFFLRGHNAPGGGFIAGLVFVLAVFLQSMGGGIAATERQWRVDWTAWIGWGLLVAVATGIGAFFFGHPLLTSSTRYVPFPWIGEVPFASAMGFDTGVYVTVSASLMLILILLARLMTKEGKR